VDQEFISLFLTEGNPKLDYDREYGEYDAELYITIDKTEYKLKVPKW